MRGVPIIAMAVVACGGSGITGSGVASFATVSAGTFHTCGVMTTGRAYCWGYNGYGELGKGDTNGSSATCYTTSCNPTPFIVSGGLDFRTVSAGFEHTCGLTTAGKAYCWGSNFEGALGDGAAPGTTPISTIPVAVSGGITFSELDASTGAGSVYTCGVTSTEELYCWGEGTDGELGNGTKKSSGTPSRVSVALNFVAVSAGGFHTCAITDAGAAYCWGRNASGQLGIGDTTERTTPVGVLGGLTFAKVSAGGSHTCGVTPAGVAYCWGYNGYGQLGNGSFTNDSLPDSVSGGFRFVAISAGGNHTCALTSAGVTYCWGNQIANGSANPSTTPVVVSGGITFTVLSSEGLLHTCGVATTGDAYCWGANGSGQLGNGTSNGSITPVRVVVQ